MTNAKTTAAKTAPETLTLPPCPVFEKLIREHLAELDAADWADREAERICGKRR